jgi:2-C-methyl-D-erythritol 4-phosphate cytidylyltransferase
MSHAPLHLIILAGGSGTRAGGSGDAPPKQFQEIGGLRLFLHSARELGRYPNLRSVTFTCPDVWRDLMQDTLRASDIKAPVFVAPAGESRTASTFNALQFLATQLTPDDEDLVAIHDAARPAASQSLLQSLAIACLAGGAAVPALEPVDTIISLDDGGRGTYLDRQGLGAVQTPQVFFWEIIEPAHRWAHQAGRVFTDDGSLSAECGHAPVVVPGEPDNRKITTADDLRRYRETCESEST